MFFSTQLHPKTRPLNSSSFSLRERPSPLLSTSKSLRTPQPYSLSPSFSPKKRAPPLSLSGPETEMPFYSLPCAQLLLLRIKGFLKPHFLPSDRSAHWRDAGDVPQHTVHARLFIFSSFQLPQLLHNENPFISLLAQCLPLRVCDFPASWGFRCARVLTVRCCLYLMSLPGSCGSRYLG